MNKWIIMGRVVADIDESKDVRYTTGDNATCITNFRIAVDKNYKNKNNPDAPNADFFRMVCFGKTGEFAKNYLHKGTKILVEARVENANYKDAEGNMVYRDQYIADKIEFAESKKAAEANGVSTSTPPANDGGMFVVPDGLEGDLPWN